MKEEEEDDMEDFKEKPTKKAKTAATKKTKKSKEAKEAADRANVSTGFDDPEGIPISESQEEVSPAAAVPEDEASKAVPSPPKAQPFRPNENPIHRWFLYVPLSQSKEIATNWRKPLL